jgi:hypothetical protein
MGGRHGPVELYGIIEIATALGVDRRKVAVWHGRGKLPPADFRASGRPFWKPETITPWITNQTEQTVAPRPAAAAAAAAVAVEGERPVAVQASTTASSSSASASSSQATWPGPAARPAQPRSRAQGRRSPAVNHDGDQGRAGEVESDPYELARGSQGWTVTFLGEPIGTVRPAWSATGRSKRWQAYSPSGARLDAHTYPTVRAAAVRVAQAHRHASGRCR